MIPLRQWNRLAFMIVLTSMSFCAFGQKSAMFSMSEELGYRFNPGYAGMESSLDVAIYGREQWSGIAGNPTSIGITAHAPAYRLKGGAGFQIENDALGPFRYLKLSAGYSYVQTFDQSILSVGAKLGINQISFDGASLRSPEGIYTGGIINHNDPNLPSGKRSAVSPTAGIGLYYIHDVWEAGIAVQDIHLSNGNIEDQGLRLNWAPGPIVNFTARATFDIQDDLYVWPSLLVMYDFSQVQTLAKLNATYMEQFVAGVGIRGYGSNSLEAVVISAGVVLDQHFSLHYSYDIGVAGLATQGGGSHEFILRYNLNKPIGVAGPPKVIENPRYME